LRKSSNASAMAPQLTTWVAKRRKELARVDLNVITSKIITRRRGLSSQGNEWGEADLHLVH